MKRFLFLIALSLLVIPLFANVSALNVKRIQVLAKYKEQYNNGSDFYEIKLSGGKYMINFTFGNSFEILGIDDATVFGFYSNGKKIATWDMTTFYGRNGKAWDYTLIPAEASCDHEKLSLVEIPTENNQLGCLHTPQQQWLMHNAPSVFGFDVPPYPPVISSSEYNYKIGYNSVHKFEIKNESTSEILYSQQFELSIPSGKEICKLDEVANLYIVNKGVFCDYITAKEQEIVDNNQDDKIDRNTDSISELSEELNILRKKILENSSRISELTDEVLLNKAKIEELYSNDYLLSQQFFEFNSKINNMNVQFLSLFNEISNSFKYVVSVEENDGVLKHISDSTDNKVQIIYKKSTSKEWMISNSTNGLHMIICDELSADIDVEVQMTKDNIVIEKNQYLMKIVDGEASIEKKYVEAENQQDTPDIAKELSNKSLTYMLVYINSAFVLVILLLLSFIIIKLNKIKPNN